ncbi:MULTISPECIES: hypothetical protein [Marinilabiliaceae]|uniref:Phosphatidylcholine 1-acylhydrolase n=1 Tax=Plebeiibacterium sediminum TaxID=2992112 RepID=A0AAE3M8D6_9BACT|nr:hypothetical protein [Plebeiobacterium sediminum]MCU4165740.1 hypothetical protein [Marinilabiliaceae bacterium A049]MCW3788978.1 hypothetical protein [Plebeiobacterium sediminum]
MWKLVILLWALFFVNAVKSQQKNDSLTSIALTTIAQVNQGNSYITFPTDIGNIEPLWFEANLIPNFYIRQSSNSRLIGVLTPQIIIRMYQEASFPVRTPSYMPQVTVYYLLNRNQKNNTLSAYGRLAHHSNGQDGDFLYDDGRINRISGSFSTNYFEGGLIATNKNQFFNAYQFFKTSFELHPYGATTPELDDVYGHYRWNTAFSIFKLKNENLVRDKKNPAISLKGDFTWFLGSFNNLNTLDFQRLSFGLTFYYHPHFLEDIGLFIQMYHGSDYYNIYYDHYLNIIRFGLMTEKLRF